MALPSQGGFSSVRRGSMYRRKRGRRGLSWLIVLLAAFGVTWMLWPSTSIDSKDQITIHFTIMIPANSSTTGVVGDTITATVTAL